MLVLFSLQRKSTRLTFSTQNSLTTTLVTMKLTNWENCHENNTGTLPEFLYPAIIRTPYEYAILAVPQPIIACLGVLLNGLFVAVVALNKNMHTITNIYLVNLAIADMIFSTFPSAASTIATTQSPFSRNWAFLGPYGCFFITPVYFIPYFASLFLVTMASVDRYLAVCFPLLHRRIARKSRARKIVIACWILALFFTAILFPIIGNMKVSCYHHPPEYAYAPPAIGYCTRYPVVALYARIAIEIRCLMNVLPFAVCFAGKSCFTKYYHTSSIYQ